MITIDLLEHATSDDMVEINFGGTIEEAQALLDYFEESAQRAILTHLLDGDVYGNQVEIRNFPNPYAVRDYAIKIQCEKLWHVGPHWRDLYKEHALY